MADTYTKEELDAAIEKAVTKATEGLSSKRDELLDEVKTLKTQLRQANGVKPEDLAALEEENAKLRVDLTAAQKAAKTANEAKDKAEKSFADEQGFTRKLLVENNLREQLIANGVTNPVHQKAAMAMLASGVQVVDENGSRVAKAGDKALTDFVKEWAGGDEGKHFVSAPSNSGGGSGGSRRDPPKQPAKTMSRSEFSALGVEGRMEFSRNGGQVVDDAA